MSEKTENKREKLRKAGILTVKEVAKFLGARSTKWVYQHKKEIPGYFELAGSHFFHTDTLNEYIETKAFGSKKGKRKNDSEDLLIKKE